MGFTEAFRTVVIGSIMLLVLVSILGALDPSLTAELTNTAAHPNGLLTLAIIAFFGLAFAMSILLAIFDESKKGRENLPFQGQ